MPLPCQHTKTMLPTNDLYVANIRPLHCQHRITTLPMKALEIKETKEFYKDLTSPN